MVYTSRHISRYTNDDQLS